MVYSDTIIEMIEGKLKQRKQLTLVNFRNREVTQPENFGGSRCGKSTKRNSRRANRGLLTLPRQHAASEPLQGKPQTCLRCSGFGQQVLRRKKQSPRTANGSIATDSLLIATNARLESQVATRIPPPYFSPATARSVQPLSSVFPAQAFEDALRGISAPPP
jgi:hypothetical protein